MLKQSHFDEILHIIYLEQDRCIKIGRPIGCKAAKRYIGLISLLYVKKQMCKVS